MSIENPVFNQLLNNVEPSVLNALRERMQFVDEVNSSLRDYEKTSDKQIRYVWPKVGSPYAAFFERYYKTLEEQLPWLPQPFPEWPVELRLSQQERAWVDLKAALDTRLPIKTVSSQLTPTQILWDFAKTPEDKPTQATTDQENQVVPDAEGADISSGISDLEALLRSLGILQEEETLGPDVHPAETTEPVREKPDDFFMPETVKLTGGFHEINDVLTAQRGSRVLVAAKPQDLATYVKTVEVPVKGVKLKLQELESTIEQDPYGDNWLTLKGRMAVKKGFVPFGAVEFSGRFGNGVGGIYLDSCDYAVPFQFNHWKPQIDEVIGNLDQFLVDGINQIVRKPWEARRISIEENELVVVFEKPDLLNT